MLPTIVALIRVTGTMLTCGNYSGTAPFSAAFPAMGTEAIMIFGMAAIGAMMRRQKTTVSFAKKRSITHLKL